MPTLDLRRFDPASREEERVEESVSDERFDRVAFTHRALDLLRPKDMTIAVCTGTRRLRVEVGRRWGGRAKERWAMLCIPPTASRRAIVMAVAALADSPSEPYVLDVLLADQGGGPYRV